MENIAGRLSVSDAHFSIFRLCYFSFSPSPSSSRARFFELCKIVVDKMDATLSKMNIPSSRTFTDIYSSN